MLAPPSVKWRCALTPRRLWRRSFPNRPPTSQAALQRTANQVLGGVTRLRFPEYLSNLLTEGGEPFLQRHLPPPRSASRRWNKKLDQVRLFGVHRWRQQMRKRSRLLQPRCDRVQLHGAPLIYAQVWKVRVVFFVIGYPSTQPSARRMSHPHRAECHVACDNCKPCRYRPMVFE